MPLTAVVEVTRTVAPTLRLPRVPGYCLGVVDYHGQLVPLIDLAARLGLLRPRRVEELVDGRLVFVRSSAGLVAYALDEVLELSEQPVEPLSATDPSLSSLLLGVVRWSETETAPVLAASSLVPLGAGVRIRQELAAQGPARSQRSPEQG